VSLVKKFAKDTAIYGLAAVLPKMINVLLVKLHTAVIDEPAAYSNVSQFYIYAVYFNVLLTFGMETAFFRFFTKMDKDPKVLQTAFSFIFLTSTFFLSILLIFSTNISGFLDINPLYFKILSIILILDTLVVIPYAYLRVSNRSLRFASFRIINILIFVLFNLIFLLLLPYLIKNGSISNRFLIDFNGNHSKVVYIFISNLIASGVTLLLFLPVLIKFKLGIDKKLLKKMLAYGIPIMIAGLAYATNENADKLFLGELVSRDVMGKYAAVYKIGALMALYVTAFKLGAEPFFFSQSKDKNHKQQYAKILLWFTIFGAVFTLGIIAFLPIIVKLLIGNAVYLDALNIVPVILIAYLFFGIYNNLSVWYKLTEKTRFAMYLSIFGAIVTITFNLLMIPKIGYMASAWATLAAYSAMTIISYFLGKKYYPIEYNYGKILFYVLSSGIIGILLFKNYYGNYLVNLSVLLVYTLLIYMLEKGDIKQLMNKQ